MSTSEKTGKIGKCVICSIPATSRCSACGNVSYCSKEHQKSDWKLHRSQCPPFKISQSNDLGRYLTATRDIKAGDVIIQEPPLVICPPRVTLPVCLGCFTEFEDAQGDLPENDDVSRQKFITPVPCSSNCGFPTCGAVNCVEAKTHEPECAAARKRGGIQIRHFAHPHPTYEAIGILRVLSLNETAPETYAKFMSLQYHEFKNQENLSNDPELEQFEKDKRTDALRVVSLTQDFFRQNSIGKDEILKILSIMETNAHEVSTPDENGQNTRHVIAVYHFSSFIEHNCIPNCVKTWDGYDIQIRASTAIRRGDHLSISYVDPMWGTEDRRHFLQISKNFKCSCDRCIDPTELGTHFSSIRCQQAACLRLVDVDCRSTKGLVVPGSSNESDWACNYCSEIYSPAYINSILQNAGKDLREIEEKDGKLEAEENFLRKFSRFLSPNHFYLMEIKLGLAQIYGRGQEQPLALTSSKNLQRKMQLCEELLSVFDVIQPGYNRLRSLVLYEKQAVASAITKTKRAIEEISLERHRDELIICTKWLIEAIKVLGWEHSNSIERKRAEIGQYELNELKLLLFATAHA